MFPRFCVNCPSFDRFEGRLKPTEINGGLAFYMEKTIISCKNVSFSYPSGRALLEDTTISFESRSLSVIQGPSGAGKSTFLRLLNRLEEPSRGVVYFNGKPTSNLAPPVLRSAISYIHQTPTLVDGTVKKNLLLPFTFHANRSKPAPKDTLLLRGLEEFMMNGLDLNDNALSLSGGEKQRLCLLRSMLISPEVMLLDEPLSALDPQSRDAVISAIEKVNVDHGITVIIVSHIAFEPQRTTPAIFYLENGKLSRQNECTA